MEIIHIIFAIHMLLALLYIVFMFYKIPTDDYKYGRQMLLLVCCLTGCFIVGFCTTAIYTSKMSVAVRLLFWGLFALEFFINVNAVTFWEDSFYDIGVNLCNICKFIKRINMIFLVMVLGWVLVPMFFRLGMGG